MSRVCCRKKRSKGGGGGQKAEKPSRVWIRELSGFCLSLAPLQGLLLCPAPSYFPSTHLSSPHHHVCWLGPVSPSCFWVESLWSPVSSDTCTQSRSEPRLRSVALSLGSGADAAGIAASLPSSCPPHLGRGAGARRLRLIRRLLLPPPPRNVPAGMVLCPEASCDPGSWKDAREGECSLELSRFGTGSFLA